MKNNLRKIRKAMCLTQQELGKKSGLSRATINQIENEKITPDGRTILKLVRATGQSANVIFFELDVVYKQLNCTRN